MSVPYHAWTHRPKAQGGTDPIAQAGTMLPYAEGVGTIALTSPWSFEGEVPLDFVFTNDTSVFGYDAIGGGISVLTAGVYLMTGDLVLDTPDTTTVSPDINIQIIYPGETATGFIDSGYGGANWSFNYMKPSFTPANVDDYNYIQMPSCGFIMHSSVGPETFLFYVRATAGSADWNAGVQLHITRLGDWNPTAWTSFP